ncbi:protein-disulfide reductase DsbD domain-containing protein [Aestuariivirga sp.]|uniref:protein-disulfide reductase DsbD domain-containing protein n=1 Tax=Aestuariivirga sp. TaxID=2650926 RepID=UPI00391DFEEF
MWFRSIIAGLACSLAAFPAHAEVKPYRVSLVGDSFDGQAWRTGVLIELDPGWKTYWRMPGEAGIPPEFTWKTSVPARIEVKLPAPARYADQSGETVGYEREVLFPVTVEAGAAAEVDLGLELFFAVCKDICIPARAEASIALGSLARDPQGAQRVSEAMKAVPEAGTAVTAGRIDMEGGKPVLKLSLKEKLEDIFVETTGTAYFRRPAFSGTGTEAALPIDNLADPAKLSGTALKLTYRLGGRGFEQTITLP